MHFPPPAEFRDVVANKERELVSLYTARLDALETSVLEKDKALADAKTHFKKLQEDFLYNLNLVDSRDRELERGEAVAGELRKDIDARDATIESLKSSLLTLQRDLLSVHSSIQSDTQRHAEEIRKIKRISEHDTSQLEDQLRKEREEKELERANLSSQIERLKGDLDAQSHSHLNDIKRLQSSNESILSQLTATQILTLEGKEKTIQRHLKESESHKASLKQAHVQILDLETRNAHARTEIRNLTALVVNKEQEFDDAKHELETKVESLQGQLERSTTSTVALHDIHESELAGLKKSHDRQLTTLSSKLSLLQTKLGVTTKDLDDRITMYQTQVEDLELELSRVHGDRSKLVTQLADSQQCLQNATLETDKKDGALSTLRQQLEILQTESESTMLKLRASNESLKSQCREASISIQQISEAYEVQSAETRRLNEDLEGATLKLSILEGRLLNDDKESEIEELKTLIDGIRSENGQLTQIIRQMRQDMEHLRETSSQSQTHNHLEEETQLLRHDNHQKQLIIDQLLSRPPLAQQPHPDPSPHPIPQLPMQPSHSQLIHYRDLKTKFRQAIQDLEKYLTERVKLIDMCNELRAEVRFWEEKAKTKANIEDIQSIAVQTEEQNTLRFRRKDLPSSIPLSPLLSSSTTEKTSAPKDKSGPVKGIKSKSDETTRKLQDLKLKGVRNWNLKD